MDITKVESKVLNFLREHFDVVVIITVTIVAVMIRFLMLKFRSGDYNLFLEPWFNEIQEKGLRGVFSSGGIGVDFNKITNFSFIVYKGGFNNI